jgi:MFS family permease
VVPASQRQRRPFDGLGFALSAVSIACLVYGLDQAGGGTNWLVTAGLLVVGLAVGAVAVRHALRHPTPMLDLSPLRVRTYAATSAEGSLLRLAINMVPFLLPLLFQVGFGLSAVTSGLLVLTVFAGNLVMKTITTPTVRRFGFRRVLVGNGVLVALSLAACALFGPSTPYWLISAVCFLGGAFRSLEFTGVNTLAFADVPAESMSAASTLNATITQLATGMGVAIAATVVHVAAGGGVPTVPDFRLGFLVGAAFALLGALLFLRLDHTAGAVVSAGRSKTPTPTPSPRA